MPCILTFSSPHTQAINGEKTEKLVKSALKLAVETISESQLHCVNTPSSLAVQMPQANKMSLFHVMMSQQILKQVPLTNPKLKNHD